MPILDQPRERLLSPGGDRMSSVELLSVLLGSGTRGAPVRMVSERLLERVGGVCGLARASPGEIMTVGGIGPARATRVFAAFQLGLRALEGAGESAPPRLRGAQDVFALLRSEALGLAQERFWVLALDGRNRLIERIEVARGSVASVEVHPGEVFRPLIRLAAAAAVIAHNHPSGDPTPSQADLFLTHRLRQAGELVGIPVVDHVVVGARDYVSIAEINADISVA